MHDPATHNATATDMEPDIAEPNRRNGVGEHVHRETELRVIALEERVSRLENVLRAYGAGLEMTATLMRDGLD